MVDGVERSFTQIDPNEVEDIIVLKDASATAVFGVRGANGVILVTTKRGTKGKAKISFSTSASVQLPTNIPEFANSYECANAYNAAQLRDGVAEDKLMFSPEVIEKFRTGSNPVLYPSVSWTDLLIRMLLCSHSTILAYQEDLTVCVISHHLVYLLRVVCSK